MCTLGEEIVTNFYIDKSTSLYGLCHPHLRRAREFRCGGVNKHRILRTNKEFGTINTRVRCELHEIFL